MSKVMQGKRRSHECGADSNQLEYGWSPCEFSLAVHDIEINAYVDNLRRTKGEGRSHKTK